MIIHNGKTYSEVMETINDEEYILQVCKLLIQNGRKPRWIVMNEYLYV